MAEETSNVKLRTLFPFLWQDELEGRAKRSVKNQLEPLLLNSYQGHKKSISGLIYCDNQILISSSSDQSVRLWHLSGQYIGILGSPIKWMELSSNVPPSPDYNYRLPPDLKREISYTTLKVLEGGKISSLMTRNIADKKLLDKQWNKEIDELSEVTEARPYRHLLKRPMIKKHIHCGSEKRFEKPILDISLPDVSHFYFVDILSFFVLVISNKSIIYLCVCVFMCFTDSHLLAFENSSNSSNQLTKITTKTLNGK